MSMNYGLSVDPGNRKSPQVYSEDESIAPTDARETTQIHDSRTSTAVTSLVCLPHHTRRGRGYSIQLDESRNLQTRLCSLLYPS